MFRNEITISATTTEHLLSASTAPDKLLEFVHVPGLHVDRPGSRETTDESLSRLHTTHGSTTCPFNSVVAAPSYEMSIVDDVLFAWLQLEFVSARG